MLEHVLVCSALSTHSALYYRRNYHSQTHSIPPSVTTRLQISQGKKRLREEEGEGEEESFRQHNIIVTFDFIATAIYFSRLFSPSPRPPSHTIPWGRGGFSPTTDRYT